MTNKDCISLIIFSLTVPEERLASVIKMEMNMDAAVFCLSPHLPFDLEKARIQDLAGREVFFISFYEFISQEEMEYCDCFADELIVNKYGTRAHHSSEYIAQIKELKNQIILKNIQKKFNLNKSILLATDLGIDSRAWIDHGFDAKYLTETIDNKVIGKRRITPSVFISFIRRVWKKKILIKTLLTSEKQYYFIGKESRVTQYLDMDNIKFQDINYAQRFMLTVMLKTCLRMPEKSFVQRIGAHGLFLVTSFFYKLLRCGQKTHTFLSTMHEYSNNLGVVAHCLGTDMICMQDGFLPSYYTSAYLKYRIWTDKFYIWDRLSKGIFERHFLAYEVWPYYKSTKVSFIENKPIKVKNVVMLTSGAGDWTALKNRSDEDLAISAFVEVARNLPNVNIIYRPHPLWMHPEHQGVRSIERLVNYSKELSLPNFIVSTGALKEGRTFTKDKQLSSGSTSINDEIDSADIVFGDHSQALISALRKGKIIASVSLAKRRDFFYDYTKLGFPILHCTKDIIAFIKRLESGSDFIADYNSAIERYNNNFS